MLINSETISNIRFFLINNKLSLHLYNLFLKNYCNTIEDLKYMADNSLITIDNLTSGYGKKNYTDFESFRHDLKEIKSCIEKEYMVILHLENREDLSCKDVVNSDEFTEIQSSLNELSNEITMYKEDFYYHLYNN